MQAKLTRREKEIFTLLINGTIPKDIAEKLKISNETVLTHQRRIYRKLDVHSIDELLEKFEELKAEVLHTSVAKKLASKPPIIKLEDGTFFTVHTLDNVYLYATRFVQKKNEWYGENYHSSDRIRLKDIYSGTVDNLIPNPSVNNSFGFRLSGNIDKESKFTKIEIHYIPVGTNNWIYLGGTDEAHLVSIGPGDFSEVFNFRHKGIDINTLPKNGVFYFSIINQLFSVYYGNIFDSGKRIPDDMPNGTIWATINNLKIEPVL